MDAQGVVDASVTLRDGRRYVAQGARQEPLALVFDAVEPDPEPSTWIARTAPVNAAGDGSCGVEPERRAREPERYDHGLTGEHWRVRGHEHPAGRDVDTEAPDEVKVTLSHDLAIDPDGAANGSALASVNERARHGRLLFHGGPRS
jgi:hypothetical protein